MPIIEARLKELGVTLPTPPMPVASYVPVTISGNIAFVSGQIPIADGAIKYVGKLGVDVPMEAGQAAAQLCAINVLAQLKADPRTTHIPVVVWSGRIEGESDRRIALDLGAEDYVEKIDAEALLRKVDRILLRFE